MVSVITWPADVLAAATAEYFPRPQSRSAGLSLGGVEQIASPATTIWTVSLSLPTAKTPAIARQFFGLVAAMQGRQNIARIPVKDHLGYVEAYSPLQTPFDDGTYFDDDTGFIADGVQPVVTSSAVAIGGTSVNMALTNPVRPALTAGQRFSHDDFLYIVTGVSGATVSFQPAARAAIASGQTLLTDPPYIKARFASDDEGRRALEYGLRAAPITLNFIEAFDR